MRANMKLLAHAMNTIAAWLTLNAAQRAACKRTKQHHATTALTPAPAQAVTSQCSGNTCSQPVRLMYFIQICGSLLNGLWVALHVCGSRFNDN
jgi:hypothetical protein